MRVGDEQILEAVEIHIQEHDGPCPVGGGDAGNGRDVRIGSVATVDLESVLAGLPSVPGLTAFSRGRIRGAALAQAKFMHPAEHVAHEDVVEAIAINVREIDAHRELAGRANPLIRERSKAARSIIDPDAIRGLEVVAHVNVRRAVAVDVAENDGKAHVVRLALERLAVDVEK